MSPRLLLFDPDTATTAWLQSLLQREGYTVDVVARAEDAFAALAQNLPAAIILERVLPDHDGLALIPQLRAAAPDAGIIILSARAGSDDVVAGLSAGADDYIPKRPGADVELVAKLRGLLAQKTRSAPPPPRPSPFPSARADSTRGKIFSFISAKGGTGTTTVCISTASAMAKLDPHASIVLVDMVFPSGTVAASIGFESRQTVARLTQNAKGKMDRATVEKTIAPFQRWGFRVLVGANDPQESSNLEVSQIVPMFEALQDMFDYVFVDFGRALSRISIPVLDISNSIVLILTPDVNTVRMTRLTVEYLESLGVTRDQLVLINNRTVGRVWISKEESERELGLTFAATIPFEQEYFTLAINSNVPFFDKYPTHAAALMFTEIAKLLRERANA